MTSDRWIASPTRVELDGWIGSAGFARGDRVVVGHWRRSPVGPITDVMWVRADDRRILLAPSDRAARFVTAVYAFDDVRVERLVGHVDRAGLHVTGTSIELTLLRGRPTVPLPWMLPPWVWARIGAPIARTLFGVEVHGTSPTGVREWYRARAWSPIREGSAVLDGHDVGEMTDTRPPLRVGFSEPPRRPSLVRVTPLLVDDGQRLAAVVGDGRDGPAPGR